MPILSATPSGSSIVCSRCLKLQPDLAFRRRSKSSELRMRQCRICHATYERQRRHAQRQRTAGLAIQKSATAIARAPNLASVSTMLELLVQQFGGPNQFYQYWFDEIERLKRKRRPTFRLLRFLEMLANLEFLHDAEIQERRKRINSPEWRSSLYAELRHLIADHPEVLIEASQRLEDNLEQNGQPVYSNR